MQQHDYLTSNSVLFWLVALIGAAIIVIGARFIVSPLPAARDFGVPASAMETSTYLWTKGTRDIVSGLLVAGLLWMRASSNMVAGFLFIASLIPFGDLLNVYAHARPKNVTALLIHGGTAVFMCIIATILMRG